LDYFLMKRARTSSSGCTSRGDAGDTTAAPASAPQQRDNAKVKGGLAKAAKKQRAKERRAAGGAAKAAREAARAAARAAAKLPRSARCVATLNHGNARRVATLDTLHPDEEGVVALAMVEGVGLVSIGGRIRVWAQGADRGLKSIAGLRASKGIAALPGGRFATAGYFSSRCGTRAPGSAFTS
jgi:hypothetical protein